jgi:hypothetical protein
MQGTLNFSVTLAVCLPEIITYVRTICVNVCFLYFRVMLCSSELTVSLKVSIINRSNMSVLE